MPPERGATVTDRGSAERFGVLAAAVASALPTPGARTFVERLGVEGLLRRVGALAPDPGWEARRQAGRLHAALLLERADAISNSFRARALPHLFMKGAALADSLYPLGERLFSDVDVHVPPARRAEALEALAQLGFTPIADREQAGPPALRSTLALTAPAEPPLSEVTVDLHWAVDPVDRLLPRGDHPLPECVWRGVETGGARNVPAPAHHAALLAHHLVHADLLHVRGLVDLALIVPLFSDEQATEYLATCAALGVGRFGRAVARLIARDLGASIATPFEAPDAPADPPFMRGFTVERWLQLMAESDPADKERITLARTRRRISLIDRPRFWTVTADAWWPPDAFLEWRWGRPLWRARARHARQVIRKVVSGLR